MTKKYFCLLFTIFTVLCSSYGQWENPSEKYARSYKAYENVPNKIPQSEVKNFVYFARDRKILRNHPFLKNPRFAGAQIMYTWKELEPEKDIYDFSPIEEDLAYLEGYGKKLFIQIQDTTFYNRYKAIPNYLLNKKYDNGITGQYDDNGLQEGWVAKRWNPKVRQRFAKLLLALGKALDGRIEGVNLQETSIGVSQESDPSFSTTAYVEAIKANMLALKRAFPLSTTIQYANFMPGEWLPWEDEGYLRSIYAFGEAHGIGLGAPDLMPTRKGQQNHVITMMHEHEYSVPLSIAVQDGNYLGETGTYSVTKEIINTHKNIVPMLEAFARDFLGVNYIFWSNEEPYFTKDVLPCFN
ncbi:hypothetical protein [Spirochaeta cellobiosiphila]|uniref:hypothetical protein n=1 Tax=Spirochaeta cellobiosiphila TaxID=504483 RepID=UPI0003FABF83|nr:hypothetical protein [Spirochaeta cellobiosiphila]